jgi:FkbM family methyltransferase
MSGLINHPQVRARYYRLRARVPNTVARLLWARARRRGDLEERLISEFVRTGDTALDIGANWGLYAWRLGQAVGAGGSVHSFEPSDRSIRVLQRISKRMPALALHEVALSDESGTANLHVPILEGKSLGALGSLNAPSIEHETHSVRTARLDEVLGPDVSPSFVKIDVEGHELAVLKGGDSLLRRSLPVLLIEIEQRHHPNDSIQAIFDWILDLGYVGYAVRKDVLAPLSTFDVQRDQSSLLGESLQAYSMPEAYVHDFVFAKPSQDMSSLTKQ